MSDNRCSSGAPRRQGGLTLLELVVTLVVGSILLAVAAPAFHELRRTLSLESAADRLFADLAMTRNHAVTHGVRVRLCARLGDQCGGVGDWNNGWLAFEDADKNGKLDVDETLLASRRIDSARVRLGFRADRAFVYYRHTGLGWPNGTFRVCAAGDQRPGRKVVVALNGRPRLARPGDDPVDCGESP